MQDHLVPTKNVHTRIKLPQQQRSESQQMPPQQRGGSQQMKQQEGHESVQSLPPQAQKQPTTTQPTPPTPALSLKHPRHQLGPDKHPQQLPQSSQLHQRSQAAKALVPLHTQETTRVKRAPKVLRKVPLETAEEVRTRLARTATEIGYFGLLLADVTDELDDIADDEREDFNLGQDPDYHPEIGSNNSKTQTKASDTAGQGSRNPEGNLAGRDVKAGEGGEHQGSEGDAVTKQERGVEDVRIGQTGESEMEVVNSGSSGVAAGPEAGVGKGQVENGDSDSNNDDDNPETSHDDEVVFSPDELEDRQKRQTDSSDPKAADGADKSESADVSRGATARGDKEDDNGSDDDDEEPRAPSWRDVLTEADVEDAMPKYESMATSEAEENAEVAPLKHPSAENKPALHQKTVEMENDDQEAIRLAALSPAERKAREVEWQKVRAEMVTVWQERIEPLVRDVKAHGLPSEQAGYQKNARPALALKAVERVRNISSSEWERRCGPSCSVCINL
jgi:hypothetical protein